MFPLRMPIRVIVVPKPYRRDSDSTVEIRRKLLVSVVPKLRESPDSKGIPGTLEECR